MNYYKAFWNETRGDEFDSWGSCTFYFEIDKDFVLKQLQLYENKNVLKYNRDSILDDEYGGLTDQPLTHDDIEMNDFEKITSADFLKMWTNTLAINETK